MACFRYSVTAFITRQYSDARYWYQFQQLQLLRVNFSLLFAVIFDCNYNAGTTGQTSCCCPMTALIPWAAGTECILTTISSPTTTTTRLPGCNSVKTRQTENSTIFYNRYDHSHEVFCFHIKNPRDALHSAVFAGEQCPSVRPSHAGIVSLPWGGVPPSDC